MRCSVLGFAFLALFGKTVNGHNDGIELDKMVSYGEYIEVYHDVDIGCSGSISSGALDIGNFGGILVTLDICPYVCDNLYNGDYGSWYIKGVCNGYTVCHCKIYKDGDLMDFLTTTADYDDDEANDDEENDNEWSDEYDDGQRVAMVSYNHINAI